MNSSSYHETVIPSAAYPNGRVVAISVPKEFEHRMIWCFFYITSGEIVGSKTEIVFRLGGQEVLRLPARSSPSSGVYAGLATFPGDFTRTLGRMVMFFNPIYQGADYPIHPIPINISCDEISLEQSGSVTANGFLACLSTIKPI